MHEKVGPETDTTEEEKQDPSPFGVEQGNFDSSDPTEKEWAEEDPYSNTYIPD